MGSLTEEELMQMVRDFHESDSSAPPPNSLSSSQPLSPPHQIKYLTLQIIWRATDCEIEILEKVLMYLRNTETLMEPNNLKNKWVVMKLKKDGYEASLCKTSWVSSFRLSEGLNLNWQDLHKTTSSSKTLCPPSLLGQKKSLTKLYLCFAQLQNNLLRRMASVFLLGEKPSTCNPSGSPKIARKSQSIWKWELWIIRVNPNLQLLIDPSKIRTNWACHFEAAEKSTDQCCDLGSWTPFSIFL
ncbi:PREDICTED: uncharacterized protein LOC103336415 isoform X2 [Prunus mume]|uniref:Uncharacterized protein LOC103336415 isoform X2 n=1 Tax=Prunus mume TaxID=102107 RepID=A0ABM1LTF0_PRUMU|nr:PREDICTED: uncharacterized protein LOC103336415 isoform X2 [Prunus mume]